MSTLRGPNHEQDSKISILSTSYTCMLIQHLHNLNVATPDLLYEKFLKIFHLVNRQHFYLLPTITPVNNPPKTLDDFQKKSSVPRGFECLISLILSILDGCDLIFFFFFSFSLWNCLHCIPPTPFLRHSGRSACNKEFSLGIFRAMCI